MQLKGFRAFENNIKNRYGTLFKPGKTYMVQGKIKFGTIGNGFHFCKCLEDILQYVDGMHEKAEIVQVKSKGELVGFYDDYYGYYDMYSAKSIQIVKVMTHAKIIAYAFS